MNTDRLSFQQRKIYEAIPEGWRNARTQEEIEAITGINRRVIQAEIMVMRRMKILIASMTNGRSGYFIPRLDDHEDLEQTRAYLNQLRSRIEEQDITFSRQLDAFERQLSLF